MIQNLCIIKIFFFYNTFDCSDNYQNQNNNTTYDGYDGYQNQNQNNTFDGSNSLNEKQRIFDQKQKRDKERFISIHEEQKFQIQKIAELEAQFDKKNGGCENLLTKICWYVPAGSKMFYNKDGVVEDIYSGGYGKCNVKSRINGHRQEAFFRLIHLQPFIDRIRYELPVNENKCCIKQYYTEQEEEIGVGLSVIVNVFAQWNHKTNNACLYCARVSLHNNQRFIKQYTRCRIDKHLRTGELANKM